MYEFNFVPKYVPENPKNTDQNDANGGAVRSSPAGRFPNITVVLDVNKEYIIVLVPYPILVLTTVLICPRRGDSENVCKNGVENYQ